MHAAPTGWTLPNRLVEEQSGGSASALSTEKVEGVGLNQESGLPLDLFQEGGGETDVEIKDGAGVEAGDVAVGIGAIPVKTATGAVEALDHAG
jgi:hypothetical protein